MNNDIAAETKNGRLPVSDEPNPQWTQDEAIAYECACEAIGHLKAIKTKLIHEEREKENPDTELIAKLLAERSNLFRERRDLKLKDHGNIARIRSEYGAIIRVFMEK